MQAQQNLGTSKSPSKSYAELHVLYKNSKTPYTWIFQKALFEDRDCIRFMQNLDERMETGQILKRGNEGHLSDVHSRE